MSAKNFLDNLTVISPCTADWESMVGNDEVRFCKHCSLEVHNVSEMTRSRAQRLIARSNGRLCVRYYQDSSGRLLSRQLPQKLHRIGWRASQHRSGGV